MNTRTITYQELLDSWDKTTEKVTTGEDDNLDEIVKEMTRTALEKQIPKKPNVVFGEKPKNDTLGRLITLSCPRCGKQFLKIYESNIVNGGRVSSDINGCSVCLQAIDFSEWKSGYLFRRKSRN